MIVFMTLLAVIIALTSLLISGLVSPFNETVSPQAAQPPKPVVTIIFHGAADSNKSLPHEDDDHDGDSKSSTTFGAFTPPPSSMAANDILDDEHVSSSVPWPGSTFIIRSVASGEVITLLDGNIVLTRPGDGRGSSHWACTETKGWLGFQNIGTGRFLGHDVYGRLRCVAEQHQGWEFFCARMKQGGDGWVLLMTHWERLWHVGVKVEGGVKGLAKIGEGGAGGIVWEFVRV